MDGLQWPAWVAGVPIGIAAFAKAIVWTKEIVNGRNGSAAESRGWMKAVLENQSSALSRHSESQQEMKDAIVDLRRFLEARTVREESFWKEALTELDRIKRGQI